MSIERWGTVHRGGEVCRVADEPLGTPRWRWTLWTAASAEGNGGEADDKTAAMMSLIHALDPDEGASERLLQS